MNYIFAANRNEIDGSARFFFLPRICLEIAALMASYTQRSMRWNEFKGWLEQSKMTDIQRVRVAYGTECERRE